MLVASMERRSRWHKWQLVCSTGSIDVRIGRTYIDERWTLELAGFGVRRIETERGGQWIEGRRCVSECRCVFIREWMGFGSLDEWTDS